MNGPEQAISGVDRHFEHLKESAVAQVAWLAARCPQRWAEHVGVEHDLRRHLPTGAMTREEIKTLCANPLVPDQACFVAIMAWGAMKYGHGRAAWAHRAGWGPIISNLRTGALGRIEAYEQFRAFRAAHRGSGMGPAYFTKLMFFADPRHHAYIMDQWTSLSINLLSPDGAIVHMVTAVFRGHRTDTVSDRNDGHVFARFCHAIEETGERLGCSAEEAEQQLFSQGGRSPAPWRAYVKANRP